MAVLPHCRPRRWSWRTACLIGCVGCVAGLLAIGCAETGNGNTPATNEGTPETLPGPTVTELPDSPTALQTSAARPIPRQGLAQVATSVDVDAVLPQVVCREEFDLRGSAAPVILSMHADRIVSILDELRTAFAVEERVGVPLLVLLFPNRPTYQAFAAEYAPENRQALGYFDPPNGWLVTYADRDPADIDRTLRHELTHYILRRMIGHAYLPPWLDEGLACYMEWRMPLGTTEETEDAHGMRRHVQRLLTSGRLPRWEAFCTLGYAAFSQGTAGELADHYAVAWSYVAYMLADDGGVVPEWLEEYVAAVAATPDPTTRYADAFLDAFGPRLNRLQSGYNLWLTE